MGDNTGIFTTQELKAQGHTAYDIHKRVKADTLVAIRPGWYHDSTADRRVLAAVKAGGVATCVTALHFYQRRGVNLWLPEESGHRVHTRLSKRGNEFPVQGSWIKVCPCYGRPGPTVDAIDSLPVALNAAARCLPPDEWIAVCDSILHNTTWTLPDLQAHMGVVPNRLRDLMARCDDRSESGPESLARVRLRAHGYLVHVQPPISRRNHRGDLRIGRLLIECDSNFHDGEVRRRDIRRDRKTLGKGWITIRVDCREITASWNEVLADINDIVDYQTWHIRRNGPLPDWIEL